MSMGGVEELLSRAEAKHVPVVVLSVLCPREVAEVLRLGARDMCRNRWIWDEFRDDVVGIVTRWTRHPT